MMMAGKEKIFLISLGCSKNLVDSEHMLGLVRSCGLEPVSSIEDADIALVNTCAFIRDAVEEAVETILDLASLKERGKLGKVVVAGCLVQRYGRKLTSEIPEVDAWLGTGDFHRVTEVLLDREEKPGRRIFISRPTGLADHTMPRERATPFYTAYLRIAEGCSHRCSYCTIPALRGPFRSRSVESLIIEAEGMACEGVKEVNLVAQDTTQYGKDLEGDVGIEDLLERLIHVEGLRWIRLLYCHPERISDRLLDLIESHQSLCPYLDIPLQHVNHDILSRMGRAPTRESPLELIERIRSRSRSISIRTTLMVGFPGETEDKFRELLDFIRVARFDHLGVFVFSPEKGTRAARLGPQVDPHEAAERLGEIMSVQAEISREAKRKMLGKVVQVLIEGFSDQSQLLLKGRTSTMAPDVDEQVLINRGRGEMGEIVPVRITEAHPYDLVGEIVSRDH